MSMVCQAHGANKGATCAAGHEGQDKEALQKAFQNDEIMFCHCGKPVKPDIVFFGEGLPDEFFQALNMLKNEKIDLLIVAGTALAVAPFNKIVELLPESVPKVLFNMNDVFETAGYYFDKPDQNRILVKGPCDAGFIKLVQEIGWADEFRALLPECHKKLI